MVKTLWIAECIFKQFLGHTPSNISVASKTLRLKMKNAAMRELLRNDMFSSLRCHDVQNHEPFQDLHSIQISKAIANQSLNISLPRYGQTFTEDKILNSKLEIDKFIRN